MGSQLAFLTPAELAAVTRFPIQSLSDLVREKDLYYGAFFREKSDGTKREINPPKHPLAEVQSAINHLIQRRLVWKSCVHGGVKGRSIISNARPHVGKVMVANLDIANFFPSVTSRLVLSALEEVGCSPAIARLLSELVTFRDALPQGAPTSSCMANLVLGNLDDEFLRICRRHRLSYTRFVDDLTVSGCEDLNPYRGVFLGLVINAGFSVSTKKIHFRWRSQQQVVTGLVVNDKLRPSKEYVAYLKAQIRRCWEGPRRVREAAAEEGLSPTEFLRSLEGRMQHIRHVDRSLGNGIKALMVRIPSFDRPLEAALESAGPA